MTGAALLRSTSLAHAADVINRAAHPLILAGNGVIRGHASHELTVLERALTAWVPVLIDCPVDYRENDPLAE